MAGLEMFKNVYWWNHEPITPAIDAARLAFLRDFKIVAEAGINIELFMANLPEEFRRRPLLDHKEQYLSSEGEFILMFSPYEGCRGGTRTTIATPEGWERVNLLYDEYATSFVKVLPAETKSTKRRERSPSPLRFMLDIVDKQTGSIDSYAINQNESNIWAERLDTGRINWVVVDGIQYHIHYNKE